MLLLAAALALLAAVLFDDGALAELDDRLLILILPVGMFGPWMIAFGVWAAGAMGSLASWLTGSFSGSTAGVAGLMARGSSSSLSSDTPRPSVITGSHVASCKIRNAIIALDS